MARKYSKRKPGSCKGKKNNFYGRKHSIESIKAMRKAHTGKKLSDKHKENIGKSKTEEKHPMWKGGITYNSGYKQIKNREHPNCSYRGYVMEHRLVVEKEIGRHLLPEEKVHHLGEKEDSRPNMLMAFVNHSAHRRFELGGIVYPDEIIFDGRKLDGNKVKS